MVASSNVEVKFRATAQGICEGMWILRVLKKVKIVVELSLKLYCESKIDISIAHNHV